MPLEGTSASLAAALLAPPEDFSAAVSVRPDVSSGLAAFCCAHSCDATRTLRAAATHQLRICSSKEPFEESRLVCAPRFRRPALQADTAGHAELFHRQLL